MSKNKIIFLIIIGFIFITLFITVIYISKQDNTPKNNKETIKIWITDGTSESYKSIIDDFKKYAPEYAKTDFIVEKQSSDIDRYRQLLLNVFTEGNGPDIFMLKSGEDMILESKITAIPNSMIDFSDFNKRYDDIFQDLLYSTGSGKHKETVLKGVPLGYETLGIFYNKSLIQEIPRTWNDLEALYRNFSIENKYPSNLGLGPTYTPNMIDILPIWFNDIGITSYADVGANKDVLRAYLGYGSLEIGTTSDNGRNTDGTKKTMEEQKTEMINQKLTTLDLFMRGDIAIIIGYPSLILELEKSSKRVGYSTSKATILTERIPQTTSQTAINIGRYAYFGISKYTTNGDISVKFLEYLMTPEAQRLFIAENAYLIPAQLDFYASVKANSLSDTINRTTLGSFIPNTREKVSVFQYGLKSRFEQYLRDGVDTSSSPDIEEITRKISSNISCEINTSLGYKESKDCQIE